jgi:hypothetical protein
VMCPQIPPSTARRTTAATRPPIHSKASHPTHSQLTFPRAKDEQARKLRRHHEHTTAPPPAEGNHSLTPARSSRPSVHHTPPWLEVPSSLLSEKRIL